MMMPYDSSYGVAQLLEHAKTLSRLDNLPAYGNFRKYYNERFHLIMNDQSPIPIEDLNYVLEKVVLPHREIKFVTTLQMDLIIGKWSIGEVGGSEKSKRDTFVRSFKKMKRAVSLVETGATFWVLYTDMTTGCQLVFDSASTSEHPTERHLNVAKGFSDLFLKKLNKHECQVRRLCASYGTARNSGVHATFNARHLLMAKPMDMLSEPFNISSFRNFIFQAAMSMKLFGN